MDQADDLGPKKIELLVGRLKIGGRYAPIDTPDFSYPPGGGHLRGHNGGGRVITAGFRHDFSAGGPIARAVVCLI